MDEHADERIPVGMSIFQDPKEPSAVVVNGQTRCYPLIGHPVAQVRTPEPMNAHFAEHGIDAVMFPVDLPAAQLPAFFEFVRGWGNCGGVSVTVPHKQAAFTHMDEVTERARRVGAVNIVRRDAVGRLIGDMVDGQAFVAALSAKGHEVRGAHVLLVGAGGAGSAIAHAMASAGARRLTILDTDRGRQSGLAEAVRRHHPETEVHEAVSADPPVRIAVNASPLGMRPGDPLPFEVDRLPPDALVADAVTKPLLTPFLVAARDRGCPIQTGDEMARAQLSFQLAHLELAGADAPSR